MSSRPGDFVALRALPDTTSVRSSACSSREDVAGVFSGSLALDLLLGDVHSLKEKRSVVRPVVAGLRKQFEVSAAEAGHLELHRRALVGVAVVAPDAAQVVRVLDACERWVAERPEVEVLSARQQLFGEED